MFGFLKHLFDCLTVGKSEAGVPIEQSISSDETCARFLDHPFKISKTGKVLSNAFEPRRNNLDVSLVRMRYLTEDECHNRGLKVCRSEEDYRGYAELTPHLVKKIAGEEDVNADIVYSPMDEHGDYIMDGRQLTTASPGIPMHAGLIFPDISFVEGEACPMKVRKFAKKLSQSVIVIDFRKRK